MDVKKLLANKTVTFDGVRQLTKACDFSAAVICKQSGSSPVNRFQTVPTLLQTFVHINRIAVRAEINRVTEIKYIYFMYVAFYVTDDVFICATESAK